MQLEHLKSLSGKSEMTKTDIHGKEKESRQVSPGQCEADNILTRDYESKTNVRESKGRKEYLLGTKQNPDATKAPNKCRQEIKGGCEGLCGLLTHISIN